MAEMKAAESRGAFDYDPKYDPANISSFTKPSSQPQSNNGQHVVTDNIIDMSSESITPLPKRKNSLDDFELEIEGITLDDDIDT